MKALVVDDQEINREILQILLEEFGDVAVAASGREAVDLFAAALAEGSPFDLVCMDISMPVMNGHEAMQQIRLLETDKTSHRATAFMVTASSDPEDMFSALTQAECDDYLPKPVIRRTFVELLQKHNLI
ncbi:MAG: response regulator [Trichlorobacter sp.]|nr:response regulator [Trichlorobacter sp.]